MLLNQDMRVFECENLDSLVKRDLGFGEVAAHVVLTPRKNSNPEFIAKFIMLQSIDWSQVDDNWMTPLDCLIFCEKEQIPSQLFKSVLVQINDLYTLRRTMDLTSEMRFSKESEKKDFELRMQYVDVLISRAREVVKLAPDEEGDPYATSLCYIVNSAYVAMIKSSLRLGHKDFDTKITFFLDKYLMEDDWSDKDYQFLLMGVYREARSFLSVTSVWSVDQYLHYLLKKIDQNEKNLSIALKSILDNDYVSGLSYVLNTYNVSADRRIDNKSLLTYAILRDSWLCTSYLMEKLGKDKVRDVYVREAYVTLLPEIDDSMFFKLVDQLITLGLNDVLNGAVDQYKMTLIEGLKSKVLRLGDHKKIESANVAQKKIDYLISKGIK